jgi:dTDP-4-dehydrorhamnose reductase
MKTILVTGSNGLLGQKIISLIRKTSRANLIATSKGENRYPFNDGYIYAEMDITRPEEVKEVIEHYKPDAIINTAAVTNVDTCHIDRDLCRKINVDAVRTLVEVSEEKGIHLIHLSTDFVFDGASGPYDEEAELNPVSYYGESKRDAELLIKASASKWSIIRTVLVYGITANMSRSNIVLWVKSSLEKGTPIKVVNDQWRTPTLAEDLAEACLLVAEKEAQGIFHISGKDMMTVYNIAEQVAEFWTLDKSLLSPISSASLNQEAKRPIKTGFILDKAISKLSYQPHSFKESLAFLDAQLKGADM